MNLNVPLILASASPRRRHLLSAMGFGFEIMPADIEEIPRPGEEPRVFAERLAGEKATQIAKRNSEALVLGSDTIVVLDEQVLGKPADEAEAVQMLRMLSGRSHQVITGIALIHMSSGRSVINSETTTVFFDQLTDAQINDYVATGSPLDKAGAYGIQDDQGAFLIHRIEGDHYTVVGLPLFRFAKELRTSFQDLISV